MRGFPKKYNSQKSTFFESGKRDYFQFFNKIKVLNRCKSDFAIFSSFTGLNLKNFNSVLNLSRGIKMVCFT